MSAVITRSPGSTSWAILLSATSKPLGTWMALMNGDRGACRSRFATSVSGMRVRSAARNRISLMTKGQASASTQICTHSPLLAHPGRRPSTGQYAKVPRALDEPDERDDDDTHGAAGHHQPLVEPGSAQREGNRQKQRHDGELAEFHTKVESDQGDEQRTPGQPKVGEHARDAETVYEAEQA